MREIKFRAWDEKNKKMIGPFYVGSELSMSWHPEMQFTGLKDKNEKEIYGGDIVRIFIRSGGRWINEKHASKIEWYKGCFCQVFGDGHLPLWWLDEDTQKFEVIGNIYENPELIMSK